MLLLDTVGSERFAVCEPRSKSSVPIIRRRMEDGLAAISRSRPSQNPDADPLCFHLTPLAEPRRMAALRIGYVREHFSSPLLQLAAQSDYIQLVECPSEPLPRRGLSFRSGPSDHPYTGPQAARARSCLA